MNAVANQAQDAAKNELLQFLEHIHLSDPQANAAAGLKRLARSKVDNAEKASLLLNLIEIDLSADQHFPSKKPLDLSPVAHLFSMLTTLKLSNQPLIGLEKLSALQNLRSLEVANCELETLDFLTTLPYLESINLSKNPKIGSLLESFFTIVPALNLKSLSLNDLALRNIDFLNVLQNLQNLSVARNNLSSLKSLADFKNIRSFNFDTNMIDDLNFLSKWKNLKSLSFKNNAVDDVQPLQDLYSLNELFFNSNKVRSLKPLRHLRDLVRVGCQGNALYDDDYDVIPRSVRVD